MNKKLHASLREFDVLVIAGNYLANSHESNSPGGLLSHEVDTLRRLMGHFPTDFYMTPGTNEEQSRLDLMAVAFAITMPSWAK
jgi:hypothetical protein